MEGESGCGKSALVEHFAAQLAEKAIVCRGKFDDQVRRPFSAIADCIDCLVSGLKADKDGDWAEILKEIEVELEVLSLVSPGCRAWLSTAPSGDDVNSARIRLEDTSADGQWSFDRTRLAVRSLLRLVTGYTTVLLTVDNLQWADSNSFACDRPGMRQPHAGMHAATAQRIGQSAAQRAQIEASTDSVNKYQSVKFNNGSG